MVKKSGTMKVNLIESLNILHKLYMKFFSKNLWFLILKESKFLHIIFYKMVDRGKLKIDDMPNGGHFDKKCV